MCIYIYILIKTDLEFEFNQQRPEYFDLRITLEGKKFCNLLNFYLFNYRHSYYWPWIIYITARFVEVYRCSDVM